MSSSRRDTSPRQVPPPAGSRGDVPYTRFIPREELKGFSSWMPDAFGERASFSQPVQPGSPQSPLRPAGAAPTPATPAPLWSAANDFSAPPAAAEPEPELELDTGPTLEQLRAEMQAETRELVAAARQQGYQDGYRDGLVALDSFKQSYAKQVSGQMTQLLASLDRDLHQLEQQVAAGVARVATELARQVVRSELVVRPALVAQVAREAVNAVLMSAHHISVLVNPEDHALVAMGCEEALAARGARLVSHPAIERGGCRVESDAGVVDARIATRWDQATQALGTQAEWHDDLDDPTPGDA